MSLLEMLQQRLGNQAVDQIGRKIGADSGTTGNAIDAALPLLLSALARNATDTGQAQSLHTAVAEDHDGSILDDVPGYLNRADTGPGASILRHVLGGKQQTVETGLSQATGLEAGKAGQLLTMLAPLVMGALGRTQQERGLDPGGLTNLLVGEQEHLKQSAPGVMGTLSRFLDRDGDGSVLDDVGGLLGKTFGGKR
ncbi:MAG TPA: DUF937 domain-containing protein [Gemmatimonadales bacterium]|jgi:hypothetical protein|nr:DUF937 domain-containing protein [Gemmatimonadales bacterium]